MKAVIFDMDGVIINNESQSKSIWEQAEKEIGVPGITDKLWSKCLGTTAKYEREQFINTYNEVVYPKFFAKVAEIRKTFPKPIIRTGVVELLKYLSDNNVRVTLVSSSSRIKVHKVLRDNRLNKYFNYVITGDDVEKSKPDPDPFKKALEILMVPSENTFVIEDSMNGIQAATKLGIRTIYFEDTDNAYDYTWKVTSFQEIIELFKEILNND